jgi:ATP-dependent Clp protease adaptor protein ClpS
MARIDKFEDAITAHERKMGAVLRNAADRKLAVTAAGEKDGNGGNGNGGKDGRDGEDGGRTGLVTKTRPKTKKPSLYKVLLLNDDYTPMEFVELVLQKYFAMSSENAVRVMLHVHQKGVGVCGVYTFEIAETKVTQVMDFSRANNHPLQCTMEKE